MFIRFSFSICLLSPLVSLSCGVLAWCCLSLVFMLICINNFEAWPCAPPPPNSRESCSTGSVQAVMEFQLGPFNNATTLLTWLQAKTIILLWFRHQFIKIDSFSTISSNTLSVNVHWVQCSCLLWREIVLWSLIWFNLIKYFAGVVSGTENLTEVKYFCQEHFYCTSYC